MSIEEYNNRLLQKYGENTFKVFESKEDIKNRDKIKVICLKCGYIREVSAREFVRDIKITGKFIEKRRCKNCKKLEQEEKQKNKKDKNYYTNIAKELLKDKFEILEYNNYFDIKVKCLRCGNIYTNNLKNLTDAKGCYKCSKTATKSIEDMTKLLDEKYGQGIYKILEIIDSNWESGNHRLVKILFKGKVFKKAFNEVLKFGFDREYRRDIEYVNQLLFEKTNGRYKVLNKKYKNIDSTYSLYDNQTRKSYNANLKTFLENLTIPSSNISTYENMLYQLLNNRKIYFKREKSFKEFSSSKKFDIELQDSKILIEADGEQHFMPVFGYNKDDKQITFESTRESDFLKNNFIMETNKTLVRIKYSIFKQEFSVLEKILDAILFENFEYLKNQEGILLIQNHKIYNSSKYYTPMAANDENY